MPEVVIGRDAVTGEVITLGDLERRSGLYVLGRSGMGKTTFLVNLARQDILNGHGLFFMDPHDGIDRLLDTCASPRLLTDLIEIDIQDDTHSVGINLLACKDVNSWSERNNAYDRARWVLFKLFEKEFGDRPWLEAIIEHSLYVFIENPEYTLADVPEFLTDKAFRQHLLRNVKHAGRSVAFWTRQFQEKYAESAMMRLTTFLGHDVVSHVVGQRQTTLDFTRIMQERKIVLVRIPATLAPDIKRFIGTIFVSELVHAVEQRIHIGVCSEYV